jgi:hypothetical protein
MHIRTLVRTLVLMSGLALLAQPLAIAQGSKNSANTITVTGCLTKGATNSFVLTPTTAGDPLSSSVEARNKKVVPTYTYQLTGGQNLDAYVGQIVSATGTEDKSKKAATDVDQKREQPADTSSSTPSGKKPTVKTEEKAKIEVRQLSVQSVTSTGKTCSSTSGT